MQNIEFYKQRSFSEKINSVFAFVRKHGKPLFRRAVVYAGPFFMLAGASYAIGYSGLIDSAFDVENTGGDFEDPFGFTTLQIAGWIGYFVFLLLGTWMMMVVVYKYVKALVDNGSVTDQNFNKGLGSSLGKLFLALLVFAAALIIPYVLLIGITFGAIAGLGGAGILLTILGVFVFGILAIYILVKLYIFPFLYIFENESLVNALKRSFSLSKGRFWSVMGFAFVIGIIQMVISYIFSIPLAVAMFIPTIYSEVTGTEDTLIATILASIVAGLLYIGSGLVTALSHVGAVFEYFNLAERKEGLGMSKRIESIEQRFDTI